MSTLTVIVIVLVLLYLYMNDGFAPFKKYICQENYGYSRGPLIAANTRPILGRAERCGDRRDHYGDRNEGGVPAYPINNTAAFGPSNRYTNIPSCKEPTIGGVEGM